VQNTAVKRRDFLTRSALALLDITTRAQPPSGEPIIDIHRHLGYSGGPGELLVESGFSPIEAIAAATTRAVAFRDRSDELGSGRSGSRRTSSCCAGSRTAISPRFAPSTA